MAYSCIGFVQNDVNSVLLLSILAMTTTVLTFPLISIFLEYDACGRMLIFLFLRRS